MSLKKGDKVKVEYTGILDDGTVFDSSDKFLRAVTGKEITPEIIAVIQSFGSKINLPTCTFFSQMEEKIKKGSSINYPSLMRA